MLNPIDAGAVLRATPPRYPPLPPEVVTNVFRVLHGFYGNLFLSKFSTGDVDRQTGEDRGLASTRSVWAHGLREFDGATIKAALARCMDRHAEFPPSLPQFVALCHACKPRNPWKAQATNALPMSPELAAQYRAEFRTKLREAAQEIRQRRQHTTGLDPLKQAIADAVRAGGGDEATELLRLDRMLSPRAAA